MYSHTEAGCSDLRALPEALDEARLSVGVLKLHCLDLTHVVKVARILVVGALLGELGQLDEAACLLVEVLLEEAADDDVHGRRLTDLIMAQAALLVVGKDSRAKLRQLATFLICDRRKVKSFGSHCVESLHSHVVESKEDEVTKVLCLQKSASA